MDKVYSKNQKQNLFSINIRGQNMSHKKLPKLGEKFIGKDKFQM